jgi:hypothetical protein
MGLAHATNTGCGLIGRSDVPVVSDPYAAMASNIPTDLPSRCSNTYAQESKHGSTWSGGITWSSGTKSLTGTASVAGNTLICGDLRLTGNVTIDAPDGAVLYIENGVARLARVHFTDREWVVRHDRVYRHEYRRLSALSNRQFRGSRGVLDIQAPTGGPFPGMALYQTRH